jgi:transglutaminase-like putative cysteine protease
MPVTLALAGCSRPSSVDEVLSLAGALRERGEFKAAEKILSAIPAAGELSTLARKKISYEIELLHRVRQDFDLTHEQLFAALNKSVRALTREEFDGWMREGRFEERLIDGEKMFAGTSVSNLYFRDPTLSARRIDGRDKETYYRTLLANCRAIKKAAAAQKAAFVMPQRTRMTMTVRNRAGSAGKGVVRAWLPIPRHYPFQKDFELVSSSPRVRNIDDEESPIRSAYFEKIIEDGEAATFELSYDYTRCAICFDLKPEKVRPYDRKAAACRQFTAEGPHVRFTAEIKKWGAKIVGKERNPLRKAKAIYDWIGDNVKYSYALEYSTIPNLSSYVLSRGYGDCGQQALTFITLCRSQRIPARWQSGWFTFPGWNNMHDWAEIYVEPYGWIPVDAEFGSAVLRYASKLTPAERREVHEFYFGGLDQYRMAANCDHNQELRPAKKTFRSDDVDFQRGELECGDRNIYFDKYSHSMEIEYLK